MNEQTYLKNYKKFMLIPIGLLVLSILILSITYVRTGDIITRDISLKGGVSATIQYTQEINIEDLEQKLTQDLGTNNVLIRKLTELGTNQITGLVIETDLEDEQLLKQSLGKNLGITLTSENSSISVTSSILGENFYNQMIKALFLTFLFMGITIAIIYRTLIPSLAVVQAPISNALITLAILSLFKIPVSMAGISALLLAIGYSVDTDVLLTTKLLKRQEDTPFNRLIGALKTGLTMTATTLVALLLGLILSTSLILKEMFLVLFITILFDLTSTYLMNAGILMWYIEKKK